MKKILFVFAAIAAMTFVSCDCKTEKCDVTANDSDSVVVVDTIDAIDSTSVE